MPAFTQLAAGVRVNSDGTVVATAKVKASARTSVTEFVVACRDASGKEVDFPRMSNTAITTTGTVIENSRKFPAGTYSYWPAVQYKGQWYDIGARHSFTVQLPPVPVVVPDAPATVPTVPTTPPSVPTVPTAPTTPPVVPTVPAAGNGFPTGDLPGWKLVFSEDFTTPAPAGQFQSVYKNAWAPYNDGGQYFSSTQVSAADSAQVFSLAGGRGAAGVWGPAANQWGRGYGRFDIRCKAEAASAYGTAIMLWPSSNHWPDGEMDVMECSSFDSTIGTFHHTMDCPDGACYAAEHFDTGVRWDDGKWHVHSTEWTPGKAVYSIDGRVYGTVTRHVPTSDHRHTIQIAKNGAGSDGRFLVDWVAHYNPA